MDVKEILKYETKDRLTQVVTKFQVLQGMIQQVQAEMQSEVGKALSELRVDATQYLLEMNPSKNVWMLKPNPNAVKTEQPVLTKPAEPVKPSGDTQVETGASEKTEGITV